MSRPAKISPRRSAANEPDDRPSWFAGKGPVLKFGVKFAALMALYYILALTPFCDRLIYSYLTANAWLANGILHGLGQDTQVTDITIRSARYAITVRRGCDAIEPAWLLGAAMLAFGGPVIRMAWVSLGGIALLQVLNLARIVSLYFIGLHFPAFFNAAHVEIWPAVFILVAVCLWIGWIGWVKRQDGPGLHGAA